MILIFAKQQFENKIKAFFYYKQHYLLYSLIPLIIILCMMIYLILKIVNAKYQKSKEYKNKILLLEKELLDLEQKFYSDQNNSKKLDYYYFNISRICRSCVDLIHDYETIFKTKNEILNLGMQTLSKLIENCYKVEFSSYKGNIQECQENFSIAKEVVSSCK